MFDFLANKLSSAFSLITGQGYLSEKNIQDTFAKLQEALLEADVPYAVVEAFTQELKDEVIGQKVLKSLKPNEQFITLAHKKLSAFLGGTESASWLADLTFKKKPTIFMLMGLQGSGKTTSLAKLAHKIKTEKKVQKILCASVDFYRPAALDQLEILAKQVKIDFYRAQATAPLKAAHEIVQYARNNSYDVLLLDTAGRLHVDTTMLQELRSLDYDLQPEHKLLVLDAMTGQQSLQVAQAFEQTVGFEGALLSKIDSDTRAGAAFAFAYTLKKPILFLGIGEKPEDLEIFRADRIAGRLIGMGDMETLLEKAEKTIKKHEQQEAEKAFMQGKFTLHDFAKQMDMMNRMGSLSSIMRFIPGMSSQAIPADKMRQAETEMKKFKAIIGSMTPRERLNHKILQGSRKLRIAKGAGVQVSDINILLQRFEEMQQFAKLFKKMGNFPGLR
ncbi:MAG: signal recognition particle protein [Candidatus Babeliales bacterium]